MTKVTVELKNKIVNAPVEIKQGQYVEIDEDIYICTRVVLDGNIGCQLNCLYTGSRWDDHQEGNVYIYNEANSIRFIDSIKITEE